MSALDMMPAASEAPDRFKALHDFVSDEAGDLGFTKGAIILVTEAEGDWWHGRLESSGLDGTVGTFPANYVQALDQMEQAVKQVEIRLVAIHDFHSTEEGDLSFNKGEQLIGTELSGDWWNGRNLATETTG